jgi:ferredoxin-type protein NapF
MDLSRRRLLRGRISPPTAVPRPPWALLPDDRFTTVCTRCDQCIDACPVHILLRGDGGFPEVRFGDSGCTECGECVRVCRPQALVRDAAASPWRWRPSLSDRCLAQQQVECRVCGEVCDHGAIRFKPHLRSVAQPVVDLDACTGCGMCQARCPTQAIALPALA